eukprot:g66112.t1
MLAVSYFPALSSPLLVLVLYCCGLSLRGWPVSLAWMGGTSRIIVPHKVWALARDVSLLHCAVSELNALQRVWLPSLTTLIFGLEQCNYGSREGRALSWAKHLKNLSAVPPTFSVCLQTSVL